MRFRAHLIGASALLLLAIWLSSGTMAPYASTWAFPIVSKPCGYLYNLDHPQHLAVFQMLDGQPREVWQGSFVLRRLLFPAIAYPAMKALGYEVGGFVVSLLAHVGALLAVALFVRKRYGDGAAIAASWMLATYPGITYWAALPYANAAIVPASCALFILLTLLDERARLRSVAWIAGAMGVLFTAYDLLPFFGVAAVIVLARRRRWRALPVAALAMAVAPMLSWLVVTRVFHVPWSNRNTELYGIVARAYLAPPGLGVWLRSIADFPVVLALNYLFSNMLFLPALFVIHVTIARLRLTLVEGAVAVAVALVFLFNNLAPPYSDPYQMRGDYVPRLYQPVFVVFIVYVARVMGGLAALERAKAAIAATVFALAMLGNLTITFGPIARVPWAGNIYQRFYFHAFLESMDTNLARYGRRPLGFCDRK